MRETKRFSKADEMPDSYLPPIIVLWLSEKAFEGEEFYNAALQLNVMNSVVQNFV